MRRLLWILLAALTIALLILVLRQNEAALDELSRYYERTESMLANLARDAQTVPVVRAHMGYVEGYFQEVATTLSAGWPARGARRRVLAAAVGHAVKFDTWRSPVRDGGITRAQAVPLAAAMVESASGA